MKRGKEYLCRAVVFFPLQMKLHLSQFSRGAVNVVHSLFSPFPVVHGQHESSNSGINFCSDTSWITVPVL